MKPNVEKKKKRKLLTFLSNKELIVTESLKTLAANKVL